MTKQTRIPTIAELAKHAADLARAFDVHFTDIDKLPYEIQMGIAQGMGFNLTEHTPGKPMPVHIAGAAHQHGQHIIVAKVVTCEVSYIVQLHEIGHCAHPTGHILTKEKGQYTLLQEQSAWEWAEYQALMWTPAMEHIKTMCLDVYTQNQQTLAHNARVMASRPSPPLPQPPEDPRVAAERRAKLKMFMKKVTK